MTLGGKLIRGGLFLVMLGNGMIFLGLLKKFDWISFLSEMFK